MLSILIPTHNYNVYALAKSLEEQAVSHSLDFEILVYDDCSTEMFPDNEKINSLKNATLTKLDCNIGRSAIRNLLAKNAQYDTLLFLDADTKIIHADFLLNYIKAVNKKTQIIYGGICYQEEIPELNKTLRWLYGKKREALTLSERLKRPYLRFLTLNFLIKKSVFDMISFNETIPNLRHEDTLFAADAKTKGLNIQHIDNPVMHLGIETNTVFLKKSLESIDSLHLFIRQGLLKTNDVSLAKFAKKMDSNGLSYVIRIFYKLFENNIEKNLKSQKPSLFLFDIYRLGYFLQIPFR